MSYYKITATPEYPTPDDITRDFIINFFLGQIIDAEARTITDLHRYNTAELEHNHDYIQLLFPLPETSPYNPTAPTITPEVRNAFISDGEEGKQLRKTLIVGLEKMLWFYGFALDPEYSKDEIVTMKEDPVEEDDRGKEVKVPLIIPGNNFDRRAPKSWLCRMDHNHLRITRIIRSLRVLGCEVIARHFYQALKEADKDGRVGRKSKMYWKRAVERPLNIPPDQEDESHRGNLWLWAQLNGQTLASMGITDPSESEAKEEADGEANREADSVVGGGVDVKSEVKVEEGNDGIKVESTE